MYVLTDEQAARMHSDLINYCSDYHLDIDDSDLNKCLIHLDLVLKANQTMNLTRILDSDEAVVLHILDSLVLLPYVNEAPEGGLLDMGTGAGFPGIPLAVATGRPSTFIDSVGKKVKAVNSFVEELELLDCQAVHERLEEFARSHKRAFSVVTARALAPLPVLVEYASPYLADGGLFVITKGNPSQEEMDSGLKAARICGFKPIEEAALDLPHGLGHREFIVFKKCNPASVSLPRANGMAKKNPLA